MPFVLLLGRAYDDKSRQQKLIRESGLDWTIVRPGMLTNGHASGDYRILAEPPQWRNGLEHFPAKWLPVRRRKCDHTETSRARSDST